jgi:hypothetical protein
VTQVVQFANERVSLTSTVEKNSTEAQRLVAKGKIMSSGLDSILSEFAQPKNMTTLDKSKVDWQHDKTEVGDAHELAQQRKNGYVCGFIVSFASFAPGLCLSYTQPYTAYAVGAHAVLFILG